MKPGLENLEVEVIGLKGYTFWEPHSPLQISQRFGRDAEFVPKPQESGYGLIVSMLNGKRQVRAAARRTDRANKWRGE